MKDFSYADKLDAVLRCNVPGASRKAIARELGITRHRLDRWRKRHRLGLLVPDRHALQLAYARVVAAIAERGLPLPSREEATRVAEENGKRLRPR